MDQGIGCYCLLEKVDLQRECFCLDTAYVPGQNSVENLPLQVLKLSVLKAENEIRFLYKQKINLFHLKSFND